MHRTALASVIVLLIGALTGDVIWAVKLVGVVLVSSVVFHLFDIWWIRRRNLPKG